MKRYLIVALAAVLLVGAAGAGAGEVSILTPEPSESLLFSRNRILNVVVKVADRADLGRLNLKDDRTGRSYDPSGRYEREGMNYVHYRVPLRKGTNRFSLAPSDSTFKIKFTPLSSLLNVDFDRPGVYKFHREETTPAECAGCHTDQLPAGARVDRVLYGRFSPECYSCHSRIAVETEWRHFPSSGLLCRSCHQADPDKDQLTIPSGKVESLCFQCHVNQNKWSSMKHIHGPVGTGDCSICHDPHGSQNQYQLWADGKAKLCVVCHVDKKKYLDRGQKRFMVHGILSAKGCVICHSPHATNHRYQLVSETNELCVSCHTALQGVEEGHPVRRHPISGKEDPRREGYPFTCTSCHNPHGSKFRYLLIGDIRGGRVCGMCHGNDQKKTGRR